VPGCTEELEAAVGQSQRRATAWLEVIQGVYFLIGKDGETEIRMLREGGLFE